MMLPSTTSNERDLISQEEILKLLMEKGTDTILPVFKTLMNQAMKIERSQAIGASRYQRTGKANGYKEKTINTSLGKITLDIPQS